MRPIYTQKEQEYIAKLVKYCHEHNCFMDEIPKDRKDLQEMIDYLHKMDEERRIAMGDFYEMC